MSENAEKSSKAKKALKVLAALTVTALVITVICLKKNCPVPEHMFESIAITEIMAGR